MISRILKDKDIWEKFSTHRLRKDKICIFVKPTNIDKLKEIATKLGVKYPEEMCDLEYFMVEFKNKEEAKKYLMSFRGKWQEIMYACLYINGKFENENT